MDGAYTELYFNRGTYMILFSEKMPHASCARSLIFLFLYVSFVVYQI